MLLRNGDFFLRVPIKTIPLSKSAMWILFKSLLSRLHLLDSVGKTFIVSREQLIFQDFVD